MQSVYFLKIQYQKNKYLHSNKGSLDNLLSEKAFYCLHCSLFIFCFPPAGLFLLFHTISLNYSTNSGLTQFKKECCLKILDISTLLFNRGLSLVVAGSFAVGWHCGHFSPGCSCISCPSHSPSASPGPFCLCVQEVKIRFGL